ncbi:MAG: FtsX-like permease family protein [Lachnospiraceae bacterium]
MSSFGIAVKMLHKNYKSYLLYFITLTISSALYYNFAALKYNPQILAVSDIAYFALSIYLCTVVFVFFIYYFMLTSNMFLLKQRTKEIALYFLSGIGHRRIGGVFAIEAICYTMLSVLAGLIIGIPTSKLFIMGFAKIAALDIVIEFVVPLAAVKELFMVFSLLAVLLVYYNFRKVARMELIDLLNDAKKVETPVEHTLIHTGIGAALIIGGYLYAQGMFLSEDLIFIGLFVLIAIIAGTSIFFKGIIPFGLQRVSKNKSFLYRGSNIVFVGSLFYRTRTGAKTWAMTSICISAAITTLATSITLWYYAAVKNSDALENFAQVSEHSALYISALFSYIGPIMAVIFVFSLGLALYFRTLSEGAEDCERYRVLSKIGMTEKEIHTAISRQLSVSMLIPAVLGVCHAAVATFLLEDALHESIVIPLILAVVLFVPLYGIFYWVINRKLFDFVKEQIK